MRRTSLVTSSAFSIAAACLQPLSLPRGSDMSLILGHIVLSPREPHTGGTIGNSAPSGGVLPSTAPLESGPHTADKPYPASELHAQQATVKLKRGIGVI